MTLFADLGARLREARTEQNLQRAELAERTGLPERYLEALETGDMSALPNEVYARIYFFSYARELGLNTEELLLEWPEPDVPQPEVITESGAPPRWPLRAAAAVIAVAVVLWIVVQLRGTEDDAGEPPVQPIADPGEPIGAFVDTAESTAGVESVRVAPIPPAVDTAESTARVESVRAAPILPAVDAAESTAGVESVRVAPILPAVDTAEPTARVESVRVPQVLPAVDTGVPVVAVAEMHTLTVRSRGFASWVVIAADGDTVVAQLLHFGRSLSAEAAEHFTLTVGRPQSVTVRLDDSTYSLPSVPDRWHVRHSIVRHSIDLIGEGGP